jgi:hypothetical protein
MAEAVLSVMIPVMIGIRPFDSFAGASADRQAVDFGTLHHIAGVGPEGVLVNGVVLPKRGGHGRHDAMDVLVHCNSSLQGEIGIFPPGHSPGMPGWERFKDSAVYLPA